MERHALLAKKKSSKTFSLFQSGSGCSGSLLKWYLTRVIIAYRFNEMWNISQYQQSWYRYIGVFYRGLSTFVDTCASYLYYGFVHFCGHLRVIVCYGFVHFCGHLRGLRVMALSTFVDTCGWLCVIALSTLVDACAGCVLCAVYFSGHLRVLCVMCCPL